MGIPLITTGNTYYKLLVLFKTVCYLYIYYYKETLEKSFEIPIDKWSITWYHTINEKESTLKEIQKGT